MARKKTKLAFWFIVCALFIWGTHEAVGQEAVEVFRMSQSDEYEWTDNERQDWTVYWLCREIDALRADIATNESARREDDKELRAQLWKLALLVGGGGAAAGGGVGVVAKIIRRNGNA